MAIKVAVFDFDQTLTVEHAGPHHLGGGTDALSRLFGGHERWASLKGMLGDMASAGVELHVCTFNSEHVVRSALGASVASLFHTVAGRESFLSGKAEAVRSIVGGRAARVLFVDDDPYNVQEVATAVPGCHVRFVAGDRGMESTDIQFCLDWALAGGGGGGKKRSTRMARKLLSS